MRRVVRFEVGTRIRTPWKELRPAEDAGAAIVYQPVISTDGEVWFYTVIRHLNNLYLVEGLR